MPHEVDDIGYPIDPELRRLEFRLGDLVGEWRAAYGDDLRQESIVQEYHQIMEQLYDLGWDSVLDLENELPEEYMPKEYIKRHPLNPPKWNG